MIKKIILLPWYFVQIFTEANSFKKNPILGNYVLNRLGLHVLRLTLSHLIMNLRMFYLSLFIPRSFRREYYDNGYIVVKDVLTKEEFTTFKDGVISIESDIREGIQGNTITHRIHLDEDIVKQNSYLKKVLCKKEILNLFKFISGKNRPPISYIQVVKNNFIKGKMDPQKVLHSDTFHPTMKYWYFLQDVEHNQAPFTYIKGSHKLTLKRIMWEYKKSITLDQETLSYAKNGSFRFEQKDLDYLGLEKPQEVCVSENTLVIVNTFGLHRRGDADKQNTRCEIFGISRTNPFNAFVGFDFAFLRSFDNWKLKKFREIKDKEAEKKGGVSGWHLIKSKKLFE